MKIFPAFFVFSLSILTLMIGQAQTTTNDWHQWRGPENNGVSPAATPPVEWSEKKNLAWRAEIGGKGTGTPIVVGEKVNLTSHHIITHFLKILNILIFLYINLINSTYI